MRGTFDTCGELPGPGRPARYGPRSGFGGAQPTIVLLPGDEPWPDTHRLHLDVNPTERDPV
ncbi:hypothetical protein GCM10010329_44500 [Streptomyces spiroverticillatus]|uniref:Uncharacterized protein n=1 Tax=Streptomyces finlayi TaxID=67296 RepID=A0A918WZM8_9ACTN|nr:hypothetical protein GCM10010329_44500 [Streptomyces spiroverticillatus]GHC98829.1 hypothetical protein GCM10010334_41680 [Streptomyces finlayi]